MTTCLGHLFTVFHTLPPFAKSPEASARPSGRPHPHAHRRARNRSPPQLAEGPGGPLGLGSPAFALPGLKVQDGLRPRGAGRWLQDLGRRPPAASPPWLPEPVVFSSAGAQAPPPAAALPHAASKSLTEEPTCIHQAEHSAASADSSPGTPPPARKMQRTSGKWQVPRHRLQPELTAPRRGRCQRRWGTPRRAPQTRGHNEGPLWGDSLPALAPEQGGGWRGVWAAAHTRGTRGPAVTGSSLRPAPRPHSASRAPVEPGGPGARGGRDAKSRVSPELPWGLGAAEKPPEGPTGKEGGVGLNGGHPLATCPQTGSKSVFSPLCWCPVLVVLRHFLNHIFQGHGVCGCCIGHACVQFKCVLWQSACPAL